MHYIGKSIKTLRKKLSLTQKDFTELLNSTYGLNIERATVSKWETGFQTPSVETVILISDLFKVSMRNLYKGIVTASIEYDFAVRYNGEEQLSDKIKAGDLVLFKESDVAKENEVVILDRETLKNYETGDKILGKAIGVFSEI
ncbi:MAG: helix-turn-helix transcriptional regulator [Clostridia bacterium]|nr:helix-turn-helix transcriptional regulator [Clostridia bacterium]